MSVRRELVDAHTHLWARARSPQDWIDPVTMAAIDRDFTTADLDDALAGASGPATSVGSAVVVQSSNSPTETLDLLRRAPQGNISAVVGWADLTAAGIEDRLDAVRAEPNGTLLAGIRHTAHLEADDEWLLRGDVSRGLGALTTAGLSFDLVVRSWQLPAATRAVRAHPDLTFVLDHLGKPPIASGELDDWRRDLQHIAACPNVVAKLSGLTIEADWAAWASDDITGVLDHALDAFGPDRLMFGSDWPLVRLAGGYSAWLECYLAWSSALSPEERAAVDAGTARHVYGIAFPLSAKESS